MFQYRREAGEEVIGSLGVFAAEAEGARHQDGGDHDQTGGIRRQQPGAVDDEGRDEDECQVVDKIVKACPVELRRALLDAGEPRQHPIDSIDDR